MSDETTAPAPAEPTKAILYAPRLTYPPIVEKEFGINKIAWRALVDAIFPNATSEDSVFLALSYCKARNLDPFKRNVHIVPIWSKSEKRMVDSVWPGIGELRTTAFRTREYAGRGETVYGPDVRQAVGSLGMVFPEYAQVTVTRLVNGIKTDFAGPRVYWLETYATKARDDDTPNEMWANRPRGQIDKCAEAAALRAAFPEEIGSEYIPEEVQHGITVDAAPAASKAAPKSLDDLTARLKADNGQKESNRPDMGDHRLGSGIQPPSEATSERKEPEPDKSPSDGREPPVAKIYADAMTRILALMSKTANENEAKNLHSSAFGPEGYDWLPTEAMEINNAYDRAVLRLARAKGKAKQTEMLPAGGVSE